MTQINSCFNVADNSGVKKILCVGNLTRKTSKLVIGDLIVGVVKEIKPTSKLLYSSIVYGVIIRLKKNKQEKNMQNITFNDNAVVLVDRNLNPIGSRIFGSVLKYLKDKKYLKLNSLTVELV